MHAINIDETLSIQSVFTQALNFNWAYISLGGQGREILGVIGLKSGQLSIKYGFNIHFISNPGYKFTTAIRCYQFAHVFAKICSTDRSLSKFIIS